MNKKEFENNKIAHILFYPISLGFSKIVKIRKKLAKKPIGRYSYFFDRYEAVNGMRVWAKSHIGVETIYNYKHVAGKSNIMESFWMNSRNCQALRNRFRLVKSHLDKAITDHMTKSSDKMVVLSLAAGSARSVLEVAGNKSSVSIIAVDTSKDAISYSKKLAEKLSASNIVWHEKDLVAVDTFLNQDKKANLVEVIGLFEYLDDKQIIEFLKKVSTNMHESAVLVTSQIHPNSEKEIVKEIVDWDMIHRKKKDFIALMDKAGFEVVKAETEPQKIHTVLTLKKKKIA